MNPEPDSQVKQGEGRLTVHVTTARGAIPLEGARVTIRPYGDTPETAGDVLYSLVSDRDGITPTVTLPTKPRDLSLLPEDERPYLRYHVEVYLEGYSEAHYYGLPIFDGITAILPADLIPLSDGEDEAISPASRHFEIEPNPRLTQRKE